MDQESLKPTRFAEGDPICAAKGKPSHQRWNQNQPTSTKHSIVGSASRRPVSSGIRQRSIPEKRLRPSSAPSLLRTVGTNLPQPPGRPSSGDANLDKFRCQVEDKEVKDLFAALHRETFLTKDAVDRVDMLSDPVLFDLRVIHNASERRKTAIASRKRRIGSKRTPSKVLRDVRSMLEESQRCCAAHFSSTIPNSTTPKFNDFLLVPASAS